MGCACAFRCLLRRALRDDDSAEERARKTLLVPGAALAGCLGVVGVAATAAALVAELAAGTVTAPAAAAFAGACVTWAALHGLVAW
eukprot:gene12690-66839_t